MTMPFNFNVDFPVNYVSSLTIVNVYVISLIYDDNRTNKKAPGFAIDII